MVATGRRQPLTALPAASGRWDADSKTLATLPGRVRDSVCRTVASRYRSPVAAGRSRAMPSPADCSHSTGWVGGIDRDTQRCFADATIAFPSHTVTCTSPNPYPYLLLGTYPALPAQRNILSLTVGIITNARPPLTRPAVRTSYIQQSTCKSLLQASNHHITPPRRLQNP